MNDGLSSKISLLSRIILQKSLQPWLGCGMMYYGKVYIGRGRFFLMNQNIERWVSMKEMTEYLGVSRDTVLDWIERRSMPAAKIGRLWKFKISEVDAWMKSGVAADK